MFRSVCLLSSIVACLPATGTGQRGALHLVPAQYATIAQALAAAGNFGDTIAVAPGTYLENIVWPNKPNIRLVAIDGPAVTFIDGGGAGRVLLFSRLSWVTRSTIVEGFTIQGGLMKTDRNYGVGIHIGACSPTIRGNVIRNNVADGNKWNYGGGIYVDRSSSLIEGNTIEGNECRNGSWNYGAGIYISTLGTGKTDLIGNTIRGNRGVGGHRANGIGIYITGQASALVTGNLVTSNTANSLYYNYGVGIHVAGSTTSVRSVEIVNNTFAGNTILSTTRPYGTVYLSGQPIRFYNNIVAGNSPAGIYRDTYNTTVSADFNCVWNNGINYTNTVAAPNDLAVDPLFVSPTDYHLSPASPCVDAGSNMDVPSTVVTDVDIGPRRSDGDLDGSAGNGARVDIGADEHCVCHLSLSSPLRFGQSSTLTTTAPNGWWAAHMVSLQIGSRLMEPHGIFLLNYGFGSGYVPFAFGPAANLIPIVIPNLQGFLGRQLHFQSVVVSTSNPLGMGAFSNRLSETLW